MTFSRLSQTALLVCSALTLTACSAKNDMDSSTTTDKALEKRVERSSKYSLKSGGEIQALQRGISVAHAELNFAFDFDNKILKGLTELTLEGQGTRNALSVDLDTVFAIKGVWLDGQALAATQYSNEKGEVIITPEAEVTFPVKIKIAYEGMPRIPVRAPWDGGVMWQQTKSGEPWLATAVQGEGCDLFWPCIDQPKGEPKQTDLYITVPNNLVAASNGVLIDVDENADTGEKTFHWQTRSAHNTYGIALNVAPYKKLEGRYQSIYGNSYPIVYYYLPESEEGAQALFDEIPTMLDFFEKVIGPYPFANEKMGVVQTPHLGMEHQTINAYGNEYKKDEFGFDWLMQHEFAHEYFGNQVTNDDWDHMWIHEGFGTYMQPLFAQYLSGDGAYKAYLNKQRQGLLNAHPIVSNKTMQVEQVYERKVGPAGDIYVKGSWILHTLRNLIGDDAFFKSTRELLYSTAEPKPGNFTTVYKNTKDFIEIVNRNTGQDLQWFFDVYLYQPTLPNVLEKQTANGLELAWQVPNDLPFPMPLEVSINGKVKELDLSSPRTLKVSKRDIVIIDPNSKLLRYEQRYEDYKQYMKQQMEKRQAEMKANAQK